MRVRLLILLVIVLICLSCLWSAPQKVDIPHTDLIYQVVSNSEQDDHLSSQVGFINADDTGKTSINVLDGYLVRPYMSKSMDGIYYFTPFTPFIDDVGAGINILSGDGKYIRCRTLEEDYKYHGFVFPVSFQGKNDLLISTSERIEIINYDSEKCNVIKTLVQVPDPNHDFILSASPANKSALIIYAESEDLSPSASVDTIKTLDLQTGAEKKILEGGWNPTFSLDDQKIAYSSFDGVYVANADGTGPRRLVSLPIPSALESGVIARSPYPFWSPDGKWLVYHKCADNCQSPLDFAIYKVNVNSGVEDKITDMGLFPVWIK
jgi:hypothetical protein